MMKMLDFYENKFKNRRLLTTEQRTKINSLMDKVILGLICLLAALPFGQIINLNLGFIILNAFELIYLAMIFMLIFKFFSKINLHYPFVFFIFLGVAIIYSLYSYIAYNIAILDPLRHLRFYLPFIIALLILATGVHFSIRYYLTILVVSSIVSASSALIIHYFLIDFIRSAFAANEEVADIAEWGRLYWGNAMLVFFIPLCFFIKEFSMNKIFISIAFFITFIALFNTLSRTMLTSMLLYLLISMNASKKLSIKLKHYLLIFIFLILAFLIIYFMMGLDSRIEILVNSRFFGTSMGSPINFSSVYEEAILYNRQFLYEQYIENITNHLFIGQGLGVPVAVKANNIPVLITDISLFSFMIPFGIFGVIILFFFIGRLFFLVKRIKYTLSIESKKIILFMLVILFIVSFNFDVFSRNNFIVFYTVLLMLLDHNENIERRKSVPF